MMKKQLRDIFNGFLLNLMNKDAFAEKVFCLMKLMNMPPAEKSTELVLSNHRTACISNLRKRCWEKYK